MHAFFRAAILALCVGLLMPLAAGAASLEDDVKAAYAAWDAAFNKGDAVAVSKFYTADATFLPASHDVLKGPAGVEKFFAGLFANGVNDHKLELITVNSDASLVVAASKWSAKGKDASSFGGVATHVFKKEADGSLKLMLHTFN